MIDSSNINFLNHLLQTSNDRTKIYPKDEKLWRAQLNCKEVIKKEDKDTITIEYLPYSKSRMKPNSKFAKEGRINPKGIPYLYLSTDEKTAMSELRPWIGSKITLGVFKLKRDIKLIDFSDDDPKFLLNILATGMISNDLRIRLDWLPVNRAFSKPVSQSDSSSDYVPIQVIAEFFKKNGFDGVFYNSSLGKGQNICLFKTSLASVIDLRVFEVDEINYVFSEQY